MLRFRQVFVVGLLTTGSVVVMLSPDVDTSRSEMRAAIERYTSDRAALNR